MRRRRSVVFPSALLLLVLGALGAFGPTGSPSALAGDAPAAPAAPPAPPPAAGETTGAASPRAGSAPYDLGTFVLADVPVIDGDTIRIVDPKESVRIHAVDAEEVFHKGEEAEREAAAKDFAAYAKSKQGSSAHPRKYGTPTGEAAKAFADQFFAGVRRVRLESDEAGRDRDGFGRRLAHVFVSREGAPGGATAEKNYGEELVRAGLAPYFVKYGRSERYDARFRAAQDEARKARRGIWDDRPGAVAHYPDYDARLSWWESRAKQVDAWNAEVRSKPGLEDHVRLGVPAETERLLGMLGKRVTLFASLDRVEHGPNRLLFVDAPKRPFTVVVFDDAVWKALDLAAVESRFVRVAGTLSEFRGRIQLTLASADDVSTK